MLVAFEGMLVCGAESGAGDCKGHAGCGHGAGVGLAAADGAGGRVVPSAGARGHVVGSGAVGALAGGRDGARPVAGSLGAALPGLAGVASAPGHRAPSGLGSSWPCGSWALSLGCIGFGILAFLVVAVCVPGVLGTGARLVDGAPAVAGHALSVFGVTGVEGNGNSLGSLLAFPAGLDLGVADHVDVGAGGAGVQGFGSFGALGVDGTGLVGRSRSPAPASSCASGSSAWWICGGCSSCGMKDGAGVGVGTLAGSLGHEACCPVGAPGSCCPCCGHPLPGACGLCLGLRRVVSLGVVFLGVER